VAHRDDYGGISSRNNLAAFQATGAAGTAPTPGGIVITRDLTSSPYPQTPSGIIPFGGTGIEMQLVAAPTGQGLDIKLYRAPDSAGSPGAYALLATIPGAQVSGRAYTYRDALPVDNTTYWYKCSHIGNGVNEGSYTPDVSAVAGWLPPVVANGENAQPVLGAEENVWIDGGDFMPADNTATWTAGTGFIRPNAAATTYNFTKTFVLPAGVIITSWTLYGKRVNVGDTCTAALSWADLTGASTGISTLTLPSGGVGNTSATINHTVVASRTLGVYVTLKGNASPSDAFCYAVLLKVTRNSYRQGTFGGAAGGGGGGAPTGASYLTLGLDGTLSAERVLTAGTFMTLTDAGAGSTLTVDNWDGKYDPATATMPTETFLTQYDHLKISGSNRFTMAGTARVLLEDIFDGPPNYVGVPKQPNAPFTVRDGYIFDAMKRLELANFMRATLLGSADLILSNDFHQRSRIVLSGRG
jgi:hypothetical protein